MKKYIHTCQSKSLKTNATKEIIPICKQIKNDINIDGKININTDNVSFASLII